MSKQLSADEAAVLAAGGDPTIIEKGGAAGGHPTSQRGADGGLSGNKSGGKEMVKAKDEEDEEDEEENEEETEKSGIEAEIIDAEDLIKSVTELEAASNGLGGDSDRRAELAQGLTNGTLSKSEREELRGLVNETDDDPEDFEKAWQEEFGADEIDGDEYDVSDFLQRQTKLIAKSLSGVCTEVRERSESQRVFNSALAKSLRNMATITDNQQKLIKALVDQNNELAGRLQTVENTPLPRRSRQAPVAKPLQKSQQGEVGGGEGLNREEILDGLNQLMVKSSENSFIAPCGEPVDRAVAQYEVSGKITRGMLVDVATVLGKNINI